MMDITGSYPTRLVPPHLRELFGRLEGTQGLAGFYAFTESIMPTNLLALFLKAKLRAYIIQSQRINSADSS